MDYAPVKRRGGGRFQSGIPTQRRQEQPGRARGLLLRGVVVATYVVDDETHPMAQGTVAGPPLSVYCDVITYGSKAGMQTRLVKNCLVGRQRSGLHDGDIWQPKATTKDVTGSDLDRNVGSNSAYWDGDHVLLGFMDDSFALPIILTWLEHPSADAGVAAQGTAGDERRRLKLRNVDGNPNFVKHHGSYYGIDKDGNYLLDTRFANDGKTDSLGVEPDSPTNGAGSYTVQLPTGAMHQLTVEDLANPASPVVKATVTTTKDKFELIYESGFEFVVDDANSKVHLGGSAEKAVIDAKLQTELDRLKDEIDALKWELGKHRHPLPEFPFPLIFGDLTQCFPQPAIYIAKTQPPINFRTGGEVGADNALMDIDAGSGQYFGIPTGPTPADVLPGGATPGDTASETVVIKS